MVEIMEEVWAGLLVSQPLSAYAPDQKLPSPGELRRKILVKVKYVAPTPAGDGASALQRARSTSSTSVSEDDISLARSDQKKKKSTKILEALSRLGVYTRSYHFSSLSQPGWSPN